MGEFDVDEMIKKNRETKYAIFGNKYTNNNNNNNNNTFVGRSVCSYKPYEDCDNGGYIEGSKSKKKNYTKKHNYKNKKHICHKRKSNYKKNSSRVKNIIDNKTNNNKDLNVEPRLKTSDFIKKPNDGKFETQISYNKLGKASHIHADSQNSNKCIGCEYMNNCKLFEQGFGELCKKKTK